MKIRQVGAWLLVIVIAVGAGGPGRLFAAPSAQGGVLSFDDPSPTRGTLGATVPTASYAFRCVQDGIGSVVALTTSGDLTIDITVSDGNARAFASGSVVSSDPAISAAEAFVMPASGQCTITLARSGDSSGSYEVRLLPGYAQLDIWDTFDGNTKDPLQLEWAPYTSDTLHVEESNSQLQMDVTTDNLLGYAEPTADVLDWSDYYIQADFTITGAPSYFEYGFVMRLARDSGDDTFYSITCSSDGDWSFYYFDGNWQAIQDWTVSPVIDGTDQRPRVGVFLQGNTFRLYFNDQFVTEVTDPNDHAATGSLALAAATGVDQTDPLTVLFDNLVVTVPLRKASTLPFGGIGTPEATATSSMMGMFGATKPPEATATSVPPTQPPQPTNTPEPPFPTALQSWSGTASDIVGELTRSGLIPPGGSQQVNVPSSYGDTSSAGWSYYQLGQGRTYSDFVLAFDARLVMTGPESGCGMYFRNTASSSNSALVTENGAFLLGQWDSSGGLTDASIYDLSDAVMAGQGSTNRVIVVADGPVVLMYVNGQLVASATNFTAVSGGLALEMYVNANDAGQTVETYCQLNNIWLWAF